MVEGAAIPIRFDPEAEPGSHGFYGRDAAVLGLERALRQDPAAILIHGLGGVGKTTLTREFVEWLRDTAGLGHGCFWLGFHAIRSAEYVLNRIGEPLCGDQFAPLPAERKIAMLAERLRAERWIVVWDEFEGVAGIPGTTIPPKLPDDDREQLLAFVRALHGGRSKVVITSRSEESWLGQERSTLSLGGLQGEERWAYCQRILEDLGIEANRDDPELVELMDLLDGHPLAMRVIVPALGRRSAGELIETLRSNVAALAEDAADEAHARLFATLRLATDALPEQLRPLLVPLALHERFMGARMAKAMAQKAMPALAGERMDQLASTLVAAGLLRDHGRMIFELHPALTGFLRSTVLRRVRKVDRDEWARAFVDVMATLADELAPRELHEQRRGFQAHHANFLNALAAAERLEMPVDQAALLQALAAHSQNLGNFGEATALFQRLVAVHRLRGDEKNEAAAYHQLGMIAQQRRKLETADRWYRKSLPLSEKHGDKSTTAGTCHNLGHIAQEQRDFKAAKKWYKKSLKIEKELNNKHGIAGTYNQLGHLAQEQRDFAVAEKWYKKSLKIKKELGNEHGAAITYHQLGRIAEERRDFDAAEKWYEKSWRTNKRLGNERSAAVTYRRLGEIAEERGDFAVAEKWYKESLQIDEKLGDERGAAGTYHSLGLIAQEQRDFITAKQWYQKALKMEEKRGDELSAASIHHQLGVLAGLEQQFLDAGRCLIRAVEDFARLKESRLKQQSAVNFYLIYHQAPAADKTKLRRLWKDVLSDWPFDDEALGAPEAADAREDT